MAIQKSMTAPNNAPVSHFQVVEIRASLRERSIIVALAAFVDRATADTGGAFSYLYHLTLPLISGFSDSATLDAALVALPDQPGQDNPVSGGVHVAEAALGWQIDEAQALDFARRKKIAALDLAREARIASGASWSVPAGVAWVDPDGSSGVSAAGETAVIQTRALDLRNLQTLLAAGNARVVAGDTTLTELKVESNRTYRLTPAQVVAACLVVTERCSECYGWYWSIKAKVDAATTAAEVDAVTW